MLHIRNVLGLIICTFTAFTLAQPTPAPDDAALKSAGDEAEKLVRELRGTHPPQLAQRPPATTLQDLLIRVDGTGNGKFIAPKQSESVDQAQTKDQPRD